MVRKNSSLLLRVQFDNKLLLDILGYALSFGISDKGSLDSGLVEVDPIVLGILSANSSGDGSALFAADLDGYHITWL
jgi:hypothetical protein